MPVRPKIFTLGQGNTMAAAAGAIHDPSGDPLMNAGSFDIQFLAA